LPPADAPPAVSEPLSAPDVCLAEAAERGHPLEVILVLRGRVRRAADGRRWRIRVQGGRVVTVSAEWVVAATRIAPRPGGT